MKMDEMNLIPKVEISAILDSYKAENFNLNSIRIKIDEIDKQMLLLIFVREGLVRDIAKLKSISGSEIYDETREIEIAARWLKLSSELNIDEEFAHKLKELIIERSRAIQVSERQK